MRTAMEKSGQQIKCTHIHRGKERERGRFNHDDLCLTVTVVIKSVARTHRMSLCLFRWGVLVAHGGCNFGNVSQNTRPILFPRISHHQRPLYLPSLYRENSPTLNKIMFSELVYENSFFFTSKSKQWMTTARVIGTPLQLSHPRMLFGSVCLHLKTCSVKVIQTSLWKLAN